jgi:hypothetical protein
MVVLALFVRGVRARFSPAMTLTFPNGLPTKIKPFQRKVG